MNEQKRIKLYGNIMSEWQNESAEEREQKKKQKRKDKKWAIANPTHKAKDKRVETSMQLFQIYGIISFMCASVNALRLLHFRRSYKEPTNVLI